MATQTLTADAAVADGVTYVLSDMNTDVKAYMASDLDSGDVVRFTNTGPGRIEVCSNAGARIGFVKAESAAVLVVRADLSMELIPVAGVSQAHIADVAALTGGEAPTEAEFNAAMVKFNLVLAALRANGILKAE
jgi:hypothetical protein